MTQMMPQQWLKVTEKLIDFRLFYTKKIVLHYRYRNGFTLHTCIMCLKHPTHISSVDQLKLKEELAEQVMNSYQVGWRYGLFITGA